MRRCVNRRTVPVGLAVLAVSAVGAGVPSAAGAAATTTPAPPVPVTAAATGATNGKIAYSCFNHGGSGQNGWVVANSDGSNKKFTPWTAGAFGGSAQWSQDGTEMVHSASITDPVTGKPGRQSIVLSEADGSYSWQLTTGDATSVDVNPAWTIQGHAVWFTRAGAGGTRDIRYAYEGLADPNAYAVNADSADEGVAADLVDVVNGSDITLNGTKVGSGLRPRLDPRTDWIGYVDATTKPRCTSSTAPATKTL